MLLFGTPLLLILALAGWWIYTAAGERRWTNFAHQLSLEPGIVLTSFEKRGSIHYFSGMRDPMAADPATLAASEGLPLNDRSASACCRSIMSSVS